MPGLVDLLGKGQTLAYSRPVPVTHICLDGMLMGEILNSFSVKLDSINAKLNKL